MVETGFVIGSDPQDLLLMCAVAFASVFVLLGLLALVMQGLTTVFPPQKVAVAVGGGVTDSAVIAAVTAAASQAYPDLLVTQLKEEKS